MMGILDDLLQPSPTGPSMIGGYGAPAQPSALDVNTPAFNPLENLAAAHAALNLTPEEKALYQRHLTNLWGTGGVDNPDGSRSTLYQANMTGPDGKAYNVPTVYDGAIISDPAAIRAKAESQGWSTFPSYATPDEAEARYQAMHQFMDKDTGAYMRVRGRQ